MKTTGLRGKVVLITGATSGIGAAIAREAAARGAISLLVGRNAESWQKSNIRFDATVGAQRHTSAILQTPRKSNSLHRA
jgi:NAD(P)-dependent dehydrogenase (short-subunit alcohol dehydrogenase family)